MPRHGLGCPAKGSWEWHCGCRQNYQAQVWSPRTRKRVSRNFPTLAAAKNWRQDAAVAMRKGTFHADQPLTVREAGERWLAGAQAGTIRNRSGRQYKPSVVRGYERALRNWLLPELGARPLADVRRRDVQELVDRWIEAGRSGSTVRNDLMPLRAICRRALTREQITINPTTGIELPAGGRRRERVASPDEASQLLAALPDSDRALWTTALYAGLRRGELAALRWEDVDLDDNLLHVRASWDVVAGRIEVKTAAGERRVPIPRRLRQELLEHRLRTGRSTGLVFGRTETTAFRLEVPVRRAARIWRAAGLKPIGLHECRHTYASLMIAAGVSSGRGVNMKELSVYMGHASIQITYDRYGHLLPGSEREAASMLDRLLDTASG
jgi:integrase